MGQNVIAQNKQILSPILVQTLANSGITKTQNSENVQKTGLTLAQQRVTGYKNDLKEALTHNRAKILAVIPRIMNSQDTDGNELIQGDEIHGNFINAVGRLDDIKELGFDTLHMLPIHPTGKTHAMGTAGSLYAPKDFLTLDPELVDENPAPEAKKRIAEIYLQLTGKKIEKKDKNNPEIASE